MELFCVCFYFTLGCLSISQAVSSHRMIKSLFGAFYKESERGAEKLSDLHKTPLSQNLHWSLWWNSSLIQSQVLLCVSSTISLPIWFQQLQASLALLYQVPLVQLPWNASGFDSLVLCSDKRCKLIRKCVAGKHQIPPFLNDWLAFWSPNDFNLAWSQWVRVCKALAKVPIYLCKSYQHTFLQRRVPISLSKRFLINI